MKGIYTAIIFFAVLAIFSLQTFAQGNGSPNGVSNGKPNGYANGSGNGYSNGRPNGYANGSGNGYTNGTSVGNSNGSGNGIRTTVGVPAAVATTPAIARKVKFVGPVDNHRDSDAGAYQRRGNGVDNFAYDQTQLNSLARICLVPGARRCVQ